MLSQRPTWRASSGLWPDFFQSPREARGGAPEADALPETPRSEVIRKSKTLEILVYTRILYSSETYVNVWD
jgi:hypothetical protein